MRESATVISTNRRWPQNSRPSDPVFIQVSESVTGSVAAASWPHDLLGLWEQSDGQNGVFHAWVLGGDHFDWLAGDHPAAAVSRVNSIAQKALEQSRAFSACLLKGAEKGRPDGCSVAQAV
ncbi:hypothetical protein NRB16_28495 [Pseudomonas sp. LJDD11]|uniref:hypothetical protein n=1 Tax=Pseudomonas sp. LJDD11 TaxID=2931984 RepID=UPI00211C7D3C|nr:hypothetical protein [Pseudomonas sp. LJDD11]MCQ9427459.1 hypothetical protein [Pseudomonas sp. LJDD11]